MQRKTEARRGFASPPGASFHLTQGKPTICSANGSEVVNSRALTIGQLAFPSYLVVVLSACPFACIL